MCMYVCNLGSSVCTYMYVQEIHEGQDELVAILRTKLTKSLNRYINTTSYLYPWSNFFLKMATSSS